MVSARQGHSISTVDPGREIPRTPRLYRLTNAFLTLALLSATPTLPQAHRGATPTTSVAEAMRGGPA